jgi:hypothetical protein
MSLGASEDDPLSWVTRVMMTMKTPWMLVKLYELSILEGSMHSEQTAN